MKLESKFNKKEHRLTSTLKIVSVRYFYFSENVNFKMQLYTIGHDITSHFNHIYLRDHYGRY
jgi:hypothetical protein